jgi:predicted ATPase/class 3 adenylate cyclase
MTFDEILAQIIALLQRQGRVSYGALKRRFTLDDDYLDDLKTELIDAQRLAIDEDGRVLVWSGVSGVTPVRLPAPLAPPASLADEPPQEHAPAGALPSAEAERRQITVLFCDLVGSTALAGQLDPEDLREVVRAYQETAATVIQRYEGHIAQYLGDGLLVYFGYPAAHEDDAQRAVYAGLGIVAAVALLNVRLMSERGIRLAVRLGIHTGPVVVGDVGEGARREQLALGETPNIAARLQGLAAPDTVVISTATFRLVDGYFTCHALGAHTLKGLAMPLQVYHVVHERSTRSRFDVVATRGLTSLVGREQEMDMLLARWTQAQDGRGQVVLLSGEAGIGKSRLVQELKGHVAGESAIQITLRCSPYHTHSALYPMIEHLHYLLQDAQDDPLTTPLAILERLLAAAGFPLSEAVPLFAALLSLVVPEHYPPLTLSPQRQKQQTLESLVAWLLAETERQPVLAIWEDVQWADPSSLELLTLTLDQTPMARLLLLVTCRPDFVPPWAFRSHLTPLHLSRLSRPQAEILAERVAGGKTLPTEVCQQIITKTDGVPLFVEELTKTVLESGLLREQVDHYTLRAPLPPLAIPATLHDSLMARLDRLASVKAVAQLGATIGRHFAYELLQAVSLWDEPTLQHGLRQLVEAELLYQRGVLPQATYLFKHALIQEAAYQSLLRSTRQQYHQRIAQVLEERFAETVETQPELVAHHYTEASLQEPAITYWHRAGQRAQQRSAYVEAHRYLETGLDLLMTLPETPERAQHELTLQLTLGSTLTATRGYASPDVEQIYARARVLCQQFGDTPQLFPVLRGLHRFYLVRAQFQTAHALGAQCLRLAQQVQDAALLLDAQFALGESLFYLGELGAAHEYLTQGFTLYAAEAQSAPVFRVAQDLGVSYLFHIAWVLWLRGFPHQALQRSAQALALARDLAHPFSLAYALNFTTMFQQLRRDVPAAHEHAVATMTLSAAQGFPVFETLGRLMQGWARAAQGQAEEGLAQLLQGWAAYQATGAALFRSYFLTRLAETYGYGRQPEAGLRVLAEALAAEQTSGERFYTAELHRLRGELLLQSAAWEPEPGSSSSRSAARNPHAGEAETCFRQALDLARQQQAKYHELRAAMSLSRLWWQQGKRAEAHQLLAEIYHWFTEGFDTADLQEARALLEDLV